VTVAVMRLSSGSATFASSGILGTSHHIRLSEACCARGRAHSEAVKICSTRRADSLNVEGMRAKLLTSICVLAVGLCGATSSVAGENGGPMETAADALVVRPACLVATVVGSAVFVVALPAALLSKSVKKTADTLVVKPANATFTRPLGDMDALKE
jgi:hypothetical protein